MISHVYINVSIIYRIYIIHIHTLKYKPEFYQNRLKNGYNYSISRRTMPSLFGWI